MQALHWPTCHRGRLHGRVLAARARELAFRLPQVLPVADDAVLGCARCSLRVGASQDSDSLRDTVASLTGNSQVSPYPVLRYGGFFVLWLDSCHAGQQFAQPMLNHGLRAKCMLPGLFRGSLLGVTPSGLFFHGHRMMPGFQVAIAFECPLLPRLFASSSALLRILSVIHSGTEEVADQCVHC